jgi:hypothetical protein
MYVWSGSAWTEISSSAEIIAYKYTGAGGATSVSGADDNGLTLTYTVGKEQVYINGVLQVRGSDYVATTGSSITGMAAMLADDIVTVLAFTAFVVANTYTQAEADAKFFQTANAFLAGKNKIINGDFFINQRNFTSETANGIYIFDRWRTGTGTGGTVTFTPQTFTPGTAPVSGYEGKNYLQIVTSGQTGTAGRAVVQQPIEDVRTFAGQTVTVSFWAKAASGTPNVNVEITQGFGSGGSAQVTGIKTTVQTITTSWNRYSFTIAVPSVSGKTIGDGSSMQPTIVVSGGSDFDARYGVIGNQNNTFQIWGVQIEAGSIATPFQTATGTIQGELAAAQRYYQRITAEVAYQNFGVGFFGDTTTARVLVPFKTTMRTAPSFAASGSFDTQAGFTSRGTAAPTLTGDGTNTQIATLNSVVSGATAAQAAVIRANNSTTTYIEFSSEL